MPGSVVLASVVLPGGNLITCAASAETPQRIVSAYAAQAPVTRTASRGDVGLPI